MTDHAYILGAQRTPIGSFQGALSNRTAPELGAHAVRAAVESARVDPDAIDEVFLGCVVSAGVGQAPARQAMRLAGIPDGVGATTVNKVCGSGMKAAMLATDLIRAGSARCLVAGGMESMSNAPYLMQKARAGLRMGHAELADAMFLDGLEDAETGGSMGSFAQHTADQHQLTREAMDEFAIGSVTKARAAMASGALNAEISPMDEVVEDEQPGRSKIDRIPSLRPAFKKDGTITAANASSISDGRIRPSRRRRGEPPVMANRWPGSSTMPRTRFTLRSSRWPPPVPSPGCSTRSGGRKTTSISSRSTRRSRAYR